ncbi:hypothetical protein [Mariprofundus sp. EBB-1]|uniref:hypothetical protein n=1 Tax=Mariprofundus sp. EBB-1 TaxID=2650971 RepID=UPI0011C3C50D|nr:hypothetical protein [Mariprofundus sp. EBB-1]
MDKQKQRLGICHGPRCGDYGGRAMGEALMDRSISFDPLPCQSLCPHAPIARVDGKVLHHTNLEQVLDSL